MAWSFRKKIKIAPGVHINLSKSGVSTSLGPKGAKINIGPKGTFLTTGIPGTGIYNRQKIGNGKTTSPSHNHSFTGTPSREKSNGHGCLKTFIWFMLINLCLAFIGGIITLVDYNKEISSFSAAETMIEISPDESDSVEEDLLSEDVLSAVPERTLQGVQDDIRTSWIELFILGIFIMLCIWRLVKLKRKNDTVSFSSHKKTTPSAKTSISISQQITELKSKYEVESNIFKKKIIGNSLSRLLDTDISQRLDPAIEKLQHRISKRPKSELKEQLDVLTAERTKQQEEILRLKYDIVSELSDQEIQKYSFFCDSFVALKNCERTWTIVSQKDNNEIKSSAKTLVDRKDFLFLTGCYKELEIPYQVPKIPLGLYRNLYFYPRFVIDEKPTRDFDVIPITHISLQYKGSRFQESGPVPSDAEKIGSTYKYINKDGGPDRRFSYNPEIPLMLYGDLILSPYDLIYEVSNNKMAIQFCSAFLDLKTASMESDAGHLISVSPNNLATDRPKAFTNVLQDQDERLAEAARMVVINQRCSTSELQRKMGIGYAKAGRILDQLEMLGIVGSQNGSNPREVLVSNLAQLEGILSLNYNAYKSADISEQFFYDVLSASQRLLEFGKKLACDDQFCKLLGEKVEGAIIKNDKTLTEPKEKIDAYLHADVIRSYTDLGHEIDMDTPEGFGLMLFGLVMLDRGAPLQYEHLDMYRETVQGPAQKMLREMSESIKNNPDIFVLEACLKEYDEVLHNQYVVLLYRFASIIAKADKTVSIGEAASLNKIIQLKIDFESPKEIKFDTNPEKKNKTSRTKLQAKKELDALIGLSSVKAEINSLTNYIRVQKMRQEQGMKVTPVSYHCVFTGNPGTGKTTVARIVAEIYKELGILSKGHLIETDRSGLVAEYVGQTAAKTNKIIDSAMDGILFIDEAYSLVDGGHSDYGKEAIATLLKRMEDDRNRLVVILAGYTDDMKRFIDSNPGLQSRFNRYIEFPDYSGDELFQIFETCARKYEYALTDEAKDALKESIDKSIARKDKNFGNGRYVRNFFEKVVENQANRLSSEADVTSEILARIEAEDIYNSL